MSIVAQKNTKSDKKLQNPQKTAIKMLIQFFDQFLVKFFVQCPCIYFCIGKNNGRILRNFQEVAFMTLRADRKKICFTFLFNRISKKKKINPRFSNKKSSSIIKTKKCRSTKFGPKSHKEYKKSLLFSMQSMQHK